MKETLTYYGHFVYLPIMALATEREEERSEGERRRRGRMGRVEWRREGGGGGREEEEEGQIR